MRNHSESPGNESDSPDGVVERIVAWSVQQRLTVLVMVLAVAAAGVWALRTLRVDAFPDLTDAQLIDAMMEHPILINRPLVVSPLGVKLCRPSEEVLDLIPAAQRAAFAKEDGEQVIDAAGNRVVN